MLLITSRLFLHKTSHSTPLKTTRKWVVWRKVSNSMPIPPSTLRFPVWYFVYNVSSLLNVVSTYNSSIKKTFQNKSFTINIVWRDLEMFKYLDLKLFPNHDGADKPLITCSETEASAEERDVELVCVASSNPHLVAFYWDASTFVI